MSLALVSRGLLRARRTLTRKRRIPQASPFVQGHPLAEARALVRAGYFTAGVMSSRAAVEGLLGSTAKQHPDWRINSPRGIQHFTRFLRQRGLMSDETKNLIRAFGTKANSAAHGNPISRRRAWLAISQAARITAAVEGGAL